MANNSPGFSSLSGRRQKSNSSLVDMTSADKMSAVIDMQKPEAMEARHEEIRLLFMDITHLSRTAQFLLLCTATFFFFLIYGYMQVTLSLLHKKMCNMRKTCFF